MYSPEESGRLPDRDVIVTQFVKLKYAAPTAMLNSVTAMLGSGGVLGRVGVAARAGGGAPFTTRIVAVPEHRMLLVTDYAPNVLSIVKTIEVLDVQALNPERRIIPLKFIRADLYAPKIQAYLQAGGAGDTAGGRRAAHVDFDDRQNCLIVAGLPDEIAQVEAMVRQLDVEVPEVEHAYRVVRLRNSNAMEMMETIQQIMSTTASEGDTGVRTASYTPAAKTASVGVLTTPTPAAGGINPAGSVAATAASHTGPTAVQGLVGGMQVNAVVNRHTNSIILMGPPREQAMIASIIEELDKRRPQVMIEALIVQVTGNKSFDIGAELAYLRGTGTAFNGATNFGLSTVDFQGRNVQIASQQGLTGFVLHNSDIQAIVHLFEQKGNGKIISRPRALVNDNEAAEFTSEQEQPHTQISSLSSTTTTVSFGGYAKAGITLDVVPHISEAGYLQLDI